MINQTNNTLPTASEQTMPHAESSGAPTQSTMMVNQTGPEIANTSSAAVVQQDDGAHLESERLMPSQGLDKSKEAQDVCDKIVSFLQNGEMLYRLFNTLKGGIEGPEIVDAVLKTTARKALDKAEHLLTMFSKEVRNPGRILEGLTLELEAGMITHQAEMKEIIFRIPDIVGEVDNQPESQVSCAMQGDLFDLRCPLPLMSFKADNDEGAAPNESVDLNAALDAQYALGCDHLQKGDLQQSVECLQEAYEIAQQIGNHTAQSDCLGDWANVESLLGNFTKAEKLIAKAILLAEKVAATTGQYLCLAFSLRKKGDILMHKAISLPHGPNRTAVFQHAAKMVAKAYRIDLQEGEFELAAGHMSALGCIQMSIENNAGGIKCFAKAVELAKAHDCSNVHALAQTNLAAAYDTVGRLKSARDAYLIATKLWEKLDPTKAAKAEAHVRRISEMLSN